MGKSDFLSGRLHCHRTNYPKGDIAISLNEQEFTNDRASCKRQAS
jgi:hypothetical protein